MRAGLLIVLVLVAVDQIVKLWAEQALPLQQAVDILPFFALFRTYNTGVAFSFLAGAGPAALIVLTLAISLFVGWMWLRSDPSRIWLRLGFALVLAGAAGNLIDRVRLGHVIDYFLFHVGTWSFAVFNLADAFITVGAVLIVLDELRPHRPVSSDPIR